MNGAEGVQIPERNAMEKVNDQLETLESCVNSLGAIVDRIHNVLLGDITNSPAIAVDMDAEMPGQLGQIEYRVRNSRLNIQRMIEITESISGQI